MSLFGGSLTPHRGSNSLANFQDEMRRFFDRFNTDFDSDTNWNLPKVEIKDQDKNYVIRAEVPGMSEKDIQVNLRDNALVIEGERKSEFKEEKEGRYTSEFSYGNFYREIPLVDIVNPETVKASYGDGILTVTLDKIGESSSKVTKIPITKQ